MPREVWVIAASQGCLPIYGGPDGRFPGPVLRGGWPAHCGRANTRGTGPGRPLPARPPLLAYRPGDHCRASLRRRGLRGIGWRSIPAEQRGRGVLPGRPAITSASRQSLRRRRGRGDRSGTASVAAIAPAPPASRQSLRHRQRRGNRLGDAAIAPALPASRQSLRRCGRRRWRLDRRGRYRAATSWFVAFGPAAVGNRGRPRIAHRHCPDCADLRGMLFRPFEQHRPGSPTRAEPPTRRIDRRLCGMAAGEALVRRRRDSSRRLRGPGQPRPGDPDPRAPPGDPTESRTRVPHPAIRRKAAPANPDPKCRTRRTRPECHTAEPHPSAASAEPDLSATPRRSGPECRNCRPDPECTPIEPNPRATPPEPDPGAVPPDPNPRAARPIRTACPNRPAFGQ